MRLIFWILSFMLFFGCSVQQANDTQIRINSLGYKPNATKKASVVNEGGNYFVFNKHANEIVFKGTLEGPFEQSDVNQVVYVADFSELSDSGTYYLQTENGSKSESFVIGSQVYDYAYKTCMRAIYLWRCGAEVSGEFNGDVFHQDVCHTRDGYWDYTEFGSKNTDGSGGWHDAGDYGKYIVNGSITLGQLFMGWQDFGDKISSFDLVIPDAYEKIPEFLEELKWETDWFLTMQYPDGSGRVSHKLTRTNFSGFIMPNNDTAKRYYAEWGTAATAHFVGSMAIAARNFEKYDAEYAKICLDAAKLSYDYLRNHQEYVKCLQKHFSTGTYEPNKTGGIIWAAAEMWETTGDASYLKDFEERIVELRLVDRDWDWDNVKNLGVYTYLLSGKEGRNPELFERIRKEMILVADTIVENTKHDVYGRPSDQYKWGCNGIMARLASNLYVASKLNSDAKYKEAAESILAHIFGRNYYGRSYVTGLGINPPMLPHDRRSAADNIENPWPGYIVGGGHSATDWVDEEESFSHNEIALNWQASLVYLLAWLASE